MARRDTAISKAMSHALRHEPEAYGLTLAPDGSVSLDALVRGLRDAGVEVAVNDIRRVVAESDKQRFAIDGDHIRAQYGHSTQERIVKRSITPQPVLWHATSPDAATAILRDGLLPMGRHYAHMSTDRELALQVGRRKAAHPVLLRIDAHATHAAGVEFAEGHDRVTLAMAVSPSFIEPVGR